MLSDRRYPSFRNFDSTISIDVIRMESYMDSLFNPTCVPVRVTINKFNSYTTMNSKHIFNDNCLSTCTYYHDGDAVAWDFRSDNCEMRSLVVLMLGLCIVACCLFLRQEILLQTVSLHPAG